MPTRVPELWFAPVQNGTANLLLTFATGTFESRFTQALISLYDATANQTLWTYSSDGGVGNVLWTTIFDCGPAVDRYATLRPLDRSR